MGLLRRPRSSAGLWYLLKNAPLAMLAQTLPGFALYAATVLLSARGDLAAVGELRLYASILALTGILFLSEMGKFFVRHVVTGNLEEVAKLFAFRLCVATVLIAAALCAIVIGWATGTTRLIEFGVVCAVSALFYPAAFFQALLTAEARFALLTRLTATTYVVSTTVLIGVLYSGGSALVAYVGFSAVNVAFGMLNTRRYAGPALTHLRPFRPRELFASDVRSAASLTAANALPTSLEHADKFLVGALFGLEALGLYTLGFSTGRLLYNGVKPVTVIYYRRMVEHRMGAGVTARLFAAGCVAGAVCAALLYAAYSQIPTLAFYAPAASIAFIIFAGYGLALANTAEVQSESLHRAGSLRTVVAAHTAGGLACYALFAVGSAFPAQLALPIFAAQFALRHAVSLLVIGRQRAKESNDDQRRRGDHDI
jgi:O-antigen/teichoic acid export membrane protein